MSSSNANGSHGNSLQQPTGGQQDDLFDFKPQQTANQSKLKNMFKEMPMLFVGGTAAIVGLIYGFSMIKKRDKNTNLGLYLVQMRVGVQGSLVMCLIAGMVYNEARKKYWPKVEAGEEKPTDS